MLSVATADKRYIREHSCDMTLLFPTAKPFWDSVNTIAGENKHLLVQTFAPSSFV